MKKYYFPLSLSLLVIVTIYYFRFNVIQTLGLFQHVQSLEHNLRKGIDNSNMEGINTNEFVNFNKFSPPDSIKARDVQQNILTRTSDFCGSNGLTLIEFPSYRIIDFGEYDLAIYYFSIEGGYFKILKLMQYLEKQENIGKLISVDFHSTKFRYESKSALQAIIYIQILLQK